MRSQKPIPLLIPRLCALFALVMARPAANPALAQPQAAVWQTYHDYQRLTDDLMALSRAHPDLIRVRSLATTEGGRKIWLATITNRKVGGGEKLDVLFDGAIHGSEVIGSESMLAYVHFLVDNYAS